MSCCTKCKKEYNPKRAGGLFCSVSCGNSYRQQLRRNEQKHTKAVEEGYAVMKPLTTEELLLWNILLALGTDAKKLLADNELPADKRPSDIGVRLRVLLLSCQEKVDSPLMKEIGVRYEAQQVAEKRAALALQEKQAQIIRANNVTIANNKDK